MPQQALSGEPSLLLKAQEAEALVRAGFGQEPSYHDSVHAVVGLNPTRKTGVKSKISSILEKPWEGTTLPQASVRRWLFGARLGQRLLFSSHAWPRQTSPLSLFSPLRCMRH